LENEAKFGKNVIRFVQNLPSPQKHSIYYSYAKMVAQYCHSN